MNKNLNFKCSCNNYLSIDQKIIMLLPCEHIIHEKCSKNLKICKLCNTKITGYFKKTTPIKNKKDYQRFIDLLCVSNEYSKDFNLPGSIDNSYFLLKTLYNIKNSKSMNEIKNYLDDILSLNYTNVHIRGLSKIKNTPHVLIANHQCYFDSAIITRYIDTKFIASESIKKNWEKLIPNFLPILYISRGNNMNTVDQMKNFLISNNSICLFPEGAITNKKTLARFRTGAFHLGVPVYPIVIRYDNFINTTDIKNFFLRLSRREKTNIYIDIIGPYYPPFSPEKIEKVRFDMAKKGNFFLSRVSTRDVKD